jgi:hypothetical protein
VNSNEPVFAAEAGNVTIRKQRDTNQHRDGTITMTFHLPVCQRGLRPALITGFTFAEVGLHLALALAMSVGFTTRSFRHTRTVGAAMRVGTQLPIATVSPFGTMRWSESYVQTPQGFDPLTWMFVWHLNHVNLFRVVAFSTLLQLCLGSLGLGRRRQRQLFEGHLNFKAIRLFEIDGVVIAASDLNRVDFPMPFEPIRSSASHAGLYRVWLQ